MHDDQLRDLFRNLEDDREPDAGFGDALFRRLGEVSRRRPQSRTPVLLLAAALLLTALAAGMALGSGWLRLPQTAEATQTPEPSPSASAVAVASPTPPAASAETSPSAAPSAAPGPVDVAGGVLFAEADGLRVRSEASGSAEIRATLRRGQLMGATGAITSVDGMDWYEVRIGPGPLEGWVAAGPDGAWLRLVDDGAIAFYCGDCGDEPAVVSITPDGDDAVTTIATAPDLQDWAWSPDGTRLAATAVGATGTSVVVMDPDGSAREEIGPGGWAPHWSPTGRLVWTTESGLVVTDEGLNPTQLDLDLRNVGGALWSPDGLRLAFSGIDCNNADCPDGPIVGDPPSAVYTVGADGDDLVQLTAGMYDGLSGWAPDGSRVAINRHDLSGEFPPRALTVPSDGGEETFLLDGGAVVSRATWSPDGSRMAISTPDGLVVMDGDGSNARVIVPAGETGIWEMAWSPSGRQILLGTGGSSAGTGLDLFVVSPDGGEPIPITPEEQESRSGVWQPILVPLP